MPAWLARLRGWRADLAAAVLGAMSALALPPVHLIPILLLTVPGLLILVGAAPNWRVALRRGLWFGFGHHLFGLYWITEAILIEAADYWWFVPIAVPGLSLVLAPFIAVPCALARATQAGWRRALMLASAWVLGDIARQFIGTGFPWNPWGSVWELPGRAGDILIQPAAWVGVDGLTLATVFLAATPLLGRRFMAGGLAVLVGWAGLGWARLHQTMPPAPDLRVVLVQGNVPQGEKWSRDRAQHTFDHYLRLTHAGVMQAEGHPSVVVWPESSFPGLLDREPMARTAIAAAAAPALGSIVGGIRFTGPDTDDAAGQSSVQPRNSLFAIDAAGRIVALYDKWHLVPGGEYAPSWLPFAVRVVPGGGFARGPGPRTLHLPNLPPFGPIICYEAIFEAQVIDEAHRPDWIVNITNDAWFGNSTGPRQHLAAARMRAVEEGLPLLRAANTGITAAFDAHGHELGRLAMNREGTLVVAMPAALPPPLAARFGLLPALLLAALGLAGSRAPERARWLSRLRRRTVRRLNMT